MVCDVKMTLPCSSSRSHKTRKVMGQPMGCFLVIGIEAACGKLLHKRDCAKPVLLCTLGGIDMCSEPVVPRLRRG